MDYEQVKIQLQIRDDEKMSFVMLLPVFVLLALILYAAEYRPISEHDYCFYDQCTALYPDREKIFGLGSD